MPENCICIAADVKGSRNKDSSQLTSSLTNCAKLLNSEYADDLLISFDVRNGDELIGVISSFSEGYMASLKMIEFLKSKGIHLYIGLGLGPLDNENANIHTMNGKSVLNAFEARDKYLKQQHQDAKQWQERDTEERSVLFFYSESYPYQALNALMYAILDKMNSRSEKQNDVIELVQRYPDRNYEQIGKQLGYKSPKSTVSYLLSRAHYHQVNAMSESLRNLLDELQKWFIKERQ